jgi:hypothetical protein
MVATPKTNYPERLIEAGIPRQIACWVATIAHHKPKHAGVERAERFLDFAKQSFENAEKLRKAWSVIEKAANPNNDALVTLFIVMPDRPEYQPFSAIYGKRSIPPDAEQERYNDDLKCVRQIIDLLNPHKKRYLNLLRDSSASPEAQRACFEFSPVERDVLSGLRKLQKVLEVVDPKAKIPTKHWVNEEDAALKNYVLLVASLNRYLVKPKHAALTMLANINCLGEDIAISADQVQKAWGRGADKRT